MILLLLFRVCFSLDRRKGVVPSSNLLTISIPLNTQFFLSLLDHARTGSVLEVNVILCFFQKRHQLLAEDDEGCPQVRRRK